MIKNFNYFFPVKLRFGLNRLKEIGETTATYGKKVLLVTGKWRELKLKIYEQCKSSLEKAGLQVVVFSEVKPNPTTAMVASANHFGKKEKCDVVVGIGGGSVMDVAKAAAIEITHPKLCFEYAYFQPYQPTSSTLPIILVTTTSGTGSHVSKYSVVTHAEKHIKTGIVSDFIFAKEAIVDPVLMQTVPPEVTAETGFDVFSHSFESYINVNATPLGDLYALEAIRILVANLNRAVRNGRDLEARIMMAWADTLAGMCISNIGTTLPHSMSQPISGHFPKVSHGTALAMVYPQFMELTWPGNKHKFASVARILDEGLESSSDEKAAQASVEALRKFLIQIGLTQTLGEAGITQDDLPVLIEEAMNFPDTRVNPVVPTKEQVQDMFKKSF